MEIAYNWVISSMNEYPKTSDNLTDVVFIVNWRRVATTLVNENIYSVDTFGQLNIAAPDPSDFTPYADLTFEQVCGWVEAGVNTADIDYALSVQLEEKINPLVVVLPLPWETNPIV